MCGRYVSPTEAAIERAVEVGRKRSLLWQARFNTAPTQPVPVLLGGSEPGYTLDTARWQFIPHWWKQDEAPRATINARLESAADKPMWRDAFASRRCLVPAMGWYEWAPRERVDPDTGEVTTIKQPHFIHAPDQSLLLFAGLYSERPDDKLGTTLTMAIITAEAKGAAAAIHDRMPVMLRGEAAEQWASPGRTDKQALQQLLDTHRQTHVTAYPVSRRVNSPRNDDAELLQPLDQNQP